MYLASNFLVILVPLWLGLCRDEFLSDSESASDSGLFLRQNESLSSCSHLYNCSAVHLIRRIKTIFITRFFAHFLLTVTQICQLKNRLTKKSSFEIVVDYSPNVTELLRFYSFFVIFAGFDVNHRFECYGTGRPNSARTFFISSQTFRRFSGE